jgi:hypothetical protein
MNINVFYESYKILHRNLDPRDQLLLETLKEAITRLQDDSSLNFCLNCGHVSFSVVNDHGIDSCINCLPSEGIGEEDLSV